MIGNIQIATRPLTYIQIIQVYLFIFYSIKKQKNNNNIYIYIKEKESYITFAQKYSTFFYFLLCVVSF